MSCEQLPLVPLFLAALESKAPAISHQAENRAFHKIPQRLGWKFQHHTIMRTAPAFQTTAHPTTFSLVLFCPWQLLEQSISKLSLLPTFPEAARVYQQLKLGGR